MQKKGLKIWVHFDLKYNNIFNMYYLNLTNNI